MTDFLSRAVAAHRSNNLAEAERLYRAALEEQPSRADARYNLGVIYGQQNRAVDALHELSLAVEAKPDFGEAWFMLCEFADQLDRQELNLRAAQQATQLLPNMPRAWLRYGLALSRLGRDEEAITAYRRALELDPTLIKAWVNLCFSSKAIGRLREAEDAIRKAIEIAGQTFDTGEDVESQYSFMHFHLALLELLQDRYREGFAHFRARFQGGTDWKRLQTSRPLWRGEDLRDKTILITAEQGHGDMLMMARYLPLLKSKGARVIFQTHPTLVKLFTGWAGADQIISLDAPLDMPFDYHAAVFDLPHRFGTDSATIPAQVPYLPIPEAKKILPTDGKPKIGVIWAGHPQNIRGKNRSVPLEIFAELFAETNCHFFSLTRDARPGENELLPNYPVTDLAVQIGDFADSARLMVPLDLVITCDTATAHLAGGMGKKTWVLLPFSADWRWGLGRDDCPWYPTLRLFRQSQRDDWTSVIRQVKDELRKFCSTSAP
jgi:tetratricopeptide (TPR) repeat protein